MKKTRLQVIQIKIRQFLNNLNTCQLITSVNVEFYHKKMDILSFATFANLNNWMPRKFPLKYDIVMLMWQSCSMWNSLQKIVNSFIHSY